MSIRPCNRNDLSFVADLHKTSLKDEVSLLTQSSPSILERFYLECLRDLNFLVNEEDGKINGFVLGGSTEMVQTARRRFYWKNLHVCLAMATRPRITRRMISRWRNLFAGTRLESQTTSIEASYALLLLAVSADARGTGLALKLVEAFEGTLTKPCRYQISVARNNLAAIRFYQKINCKVTKESRDTLQLEKNTF